jgi:peptidoglycan/LPS O-acetylase OafA/YrhL
MLVIGPLQEQRYSTAQGLSALVLTANLYAAKVSANNYFQPNPNAFLHTWSLSVEEQIYLLLPIIILCMYPIFKKLKYMYITGGVAKNQKVKLLKL